MAAAETIKQEEARRRTKIEEAKAMIEKYTEDQNQERKEEFSMPWWITDGVLETIRYWTIPRNLLRNNA